MLLETGRLPALQGECVVLELQEMCNHDLVTTLPTSALILEAADSSKLMIPTYHSYGFTFQKSNLLRQLSW